MKTQDAITYFGNIHKIAAAIGTSSQAVQKWGEYPPPLRQIQMEMITNRKLMAEQDVFVWKGKEVGQ